MSKPGETVGESGYPALNETEMSNIKATATCVKFNEMKGKGMIRDVKEPKDFMNAHVVSKAEAEATTQAEMAQELKTIISKLHFIRAGPSPAQPAGQTICGAICAQIHHIVAWCVLVALVLKRDQSYNGIMNGFTKETVGVDLEMRFVVTASLYTLHVWLPVMIAVCVPMNRCIPFIVKPFVAMFSCALGVGNIVMIVYASLTLNFCLENETWQQSYAYAKLGAELSSDPEA